MKSYNPNNLKKCLGCGAWLNNQPMTLGYTPKNTNEVELCMGCYQIKHYQKPPQWNDDQHQQLDQILASFEWQKHTNNPRFLLIIVVDINNLGFSKQLLPYLSHQQLLLVFNKADLVPFQIKQLIEQFWKQLLQNTTTPFTTMWLSTHDKTGINQLIKTISRYRKVALVGNSGVGKSNLIQELGLKCQAEQQNLISGFLNTTKAIIANKLGNTQVIDTPGVRRLNGIFAYLLPTAIKKLQTSQWKSTNFQAQDDRVYYWANYAVLVIESVTNLTTSNNLTFWGSKVLKIRHQKLNNFDPQKLLKFANQQDYHSNPIWTQHNWVIKEKTWFCIDDLGWIMINVTQPSKITFYLPEKVNITRMSFDY